MVKHFKNELYSLNFFHFQVNLFANFGGKTTLKITTNLLRKVFSPTLAKTITYAGNPETGKISFKSLGLQRIIVSKCFSKLSLLWLSIKLFLLMIFVFLS